MTSRCSRDESDIDLRVGSHILPRFNYEDKELSEPFFSTKTYFPAPKLDFLSKNIPDHSRKISFPYITQYHCLNEPYLIKNYTLLYTNETKQ